METTRAGSGPGTPDEGPGTCLERMLARAQNAFELDDALLARLQTALMHCTELHSMRRRKGKAHSLGHRTLKHVFLLADGSTEKLWEVEHNTGSDGRLVYEVYAEREAAERRMNEQFGEPPGPADFGTDAFGSFGRTAVLGFGPGSTGSPPGFEVGFGPGCGEGFDQVVSWRFTIALPPGEARHDYASDNSADHAWRVLRRAENANRPGDRVRRRLRTAVGHETSLVSMRYGGAADFLMEWALYQHAFLLADGEELSLWEVEHTNTPDRIPVCEVYVDEATARDSVDRHRRAR